MMFLIFHIHKLFYANVKDITLTMAEAACVCSVSRIQ